MSERKINIEEIYRTIVSNRFNGDKKRIDGYINTINEIDRSVVKEACRQTLELAAENAECEKITEGVFAYIDIVNRDSILKTINQIE